MVTSTGVSGLPGTTRMPLTLPMSTPWSRTGAPFRKPLELSKYDLRMILWVNHPPVPDMRKIRIMRVTLATITVTPTFSCDHFNCFWLGKFSPEQCHHSSPPARAIASRIWLHHNRPLGGASRQETRGCRNRKRVSTSRYETAQQASVKVKQKW